ncbi:aspartyl-phosphate phosphatase Spo0E family protein [Mesobacillus thioparans]|uniref:aspartyl-phosphate phosphatase Spo0E family protein n=1 Tax=Mesobacillus thioparans TaxID=370439 RepID=UPI0039F0ED37
MENSLSRTKILCCRIKILRKRLISFGELKGLTHPETVKCSEKLDRLIFKYIKSQVNL